MNCDKAQKYAMLAESGELDSRGAAALADHMAGCAACRRFSGGYARFESSVRNLPKRDGPGGEAMAMIAAGIRSSAGCGRKIVFFPSPALIAAAAGLAVAAAAAWLMMSPDGSLAGVRAAHSAVAVFTDGTFAMSERAEAHPDALRRLAMDILRLEGLAADSPGEPEMLSQFEEPTPTDPLSRSMRGSAEGIRG